MRTPHFRGNARKNAVLLRFNLIFYIYFFFYFFYFYLEKKKGYGEEEEGGTQCFTPQKNDIRVQRHAARTGVYKSA